MGCGCNATNGLGSYYLTGGPRSVNGMGAYYTRFAGMGAFDPVLDWSNWVAGASGNVAAGQTAADDIRAALTAAGYGPTTQGVPWGTAQDQAAYTAFATQYNLAPDGNNPIWWPTQAGLQQLATASAGSNMTMILGAVAVVGIAAYLMWRRKGKRGFKEIRY